MAEISQKIVRCPNGHYYDANYYQKCPYCTSKSLGSLEYSPTDLTGGPAMPPTADPYGAMPPTADPYGEPPAAETYGNMPPTADPYAQSSAAGIFPSTDGHGYNQQNGYYKGAATSFVPGGTKAPAMSSTMYVDSATPAGAPMPVVGWLVAVQGPCRGTDYRIHTGYNYIGRESGDICIRGDNTISSSKDSNITYVAQTNKFYIAHEQGKNVLLVNDLPVIGGGTELKDYDHITIGTTELIFVALCSEKFRWDEKK